jgi:hypothetical protein
MRAMERAAWPLCLAVVTAAGCFHDFDEPFSGSGGNAGEGATGGDGAGARTNVGGDRPGGSGADGGSSTTGLPEECESGVCIRRPGEEWQGPLVLYIGVEASAPSCPNSSEPVADKSTGLVTPAAICNTSCTCSNPQGGTCGDATISVYEQNGCGGAATLYLQMEDELCHDQELSGPIGTRYRSNIVTATGSCTPFGAQPVIADAMFTQWGRACDVGTGGTCAGEGVCAESAGPQFPRDIFCFGREGDHDCPVDLPDKHLLADTVTDNRVCSPCGCDPAEGRTCDGQIHIFESPGCGGQKSEFNLDGECESPQTLLPSSYRFELNNPQDGDCPPTGGEVTGAVVTSGDYTVCCSGSPD